MRIIAGEHRGRPIIGPANAERTRPITDRVKQSLFDRLAAADRLEGAVVADIFSGTGSMGLECLSRGAAHVTFMEKDRDAQSRLKKNLNALNWRRREARVLACDALGSNLANALTGAMQRATRSVPAGATRGDIAEPSVNGTRDEPEDRRFTLLFLDPPYPMMRHPTQQPRLLKQIDRLRDVATDDAMLVLRTPFDVTVRGFDRWSRVEAHPYKTMTVYLIEP